MKHAVIAGAGIVGVSAAIWLQRAGWRVTLFDRAGPGRGATCGSGGVLAACGSVPVTVPGIVRKAPRMLLDPDEPLFLRWSHLPKLAPWLLRYLKHATEDDTRRIARAIHDLVADTVDEHQALASGTGAEGWIVPSDYLYLYDDRAAFERDAFAWSIRRALGIRWDEMDAEEIGRFDPLYARRQGFAVRLGNHGRIADPGRYLDDLARHVIRSGGRIIPSNVEAVVQEGGQAIGVRAGGETHGAAAVLIAAGAWSRSLCRGAGLNVPLETERGYHLELWEPTAMPRAPVMVAGAKFVATPMEGRIRLAGFVEFGGLDAGPSPAPFALLERQAQRLFPDIRWKETRRWMGHRPAPADSIPLIGEIPGARGVYTAFGHHHIGLTAGPKTGRLVASVMSGRTPNIDLAPYSPARFAPRGANPGTSVQGDRT